MADGRSDKVLATFIVYSFSFSVCSQATGIKTDVANAPIAVVDSDRSALSARIHDGLLKPYFSLPNAINRSVVDRTMDIGAYAFVLDMPPRLEADLLRGRNPAIQLNIDAAAMTQAEVAVCRSRPEMKVLEYKSWATTPVATRIARSGRKPTNSTSGDCEDRCEPDELSQLL
jgi:hypothetical protein